jgi:hypothetical protein
MSIPGFGVRSNHVSNTDILKNAGTVTEPVALVGPITTLETFPVMAGGDVFPLNV